MLTKEECSEAYNNLYDGSYDVGHDFQIDYDVIKKLINEHFELVKENEELKNQLGEIESSLSRVSTQENSNPPLKFEDLKEGMWIYDNFLQEYMYINIIYNNQSIVVGRVGIKEPYTLIFEENRFYRYEVKE